MTKREPGAEYKKPFLELVESKAAEVETGKLTPDEFYRWALKYSVSALEDLKNRDAQN
jgi:hypothetical protein